MWWTLFSYYLNTAIILLVVLYMSVSTAEGSNSHLNRTESFQSNNVGSASNMIPCCPASTGTNAHHCDTISNRSSLSHFTKDSPSNISQVRTRPTTKKLCHCLENQWGYYLRNSDRGNAHAIKKQNKNITIYNI